MQSRPGTEGVAVVTGAARGIGAGIARAAARAGMTVVLADLDDSGVATLVERFTSEGHHAVAVPTDVTDIADVERLAEIAFAQDGPVRLLASNAGIEHVGLLWEGPATKWHEVLAVNLHGVYHGVHAFVPRLIEQSEPASLLHTSSIAAFTTGAQQGAYQTSKRAVLALSECLVAELAAIGAPIHVTVAFPGPVATSIFTTLSPPESPESAKALTMLQKLVGKRGMDPDEAGRLLFDASTAHHPWVTTDLAALREFIAPQRSMIDEIGEHSMAPGPKDDS